MSALHTRLGATLSSRQDRAILRRLTPSNFDTDTNPTPGGKGKGRMVDFSSNDYLSLSTNPAIKRRFVQAFKDQSDGGEGLSPCGPPSSRLLDGNSREHQQLERQLVDFLKSDDQYCCQTLDKLDPLPIRDAPTSRWLVSAPRPQPLSGLLFNSGFDANLSVFSTLPAPDDYILYDSLVHASTHDGMRASRVPKERRIAFKHSDMADLAAHVGRIKETDAEVAAGRRNVWIAVESLYSMDGDLCPLLAMVECVEGLLPGRNGLFVVDEAHSTGLYGREGRGLVSALGLEERVAVRVATFGKAIASSGAIVLGHPLIRQFLVNYARPLIYSTAMPRMNVVAVREVFRHLEEGGADEARTHVHALATLLLTHLAAFLSTTTPHARLFAEPTPSPDPTLPMTSPIVPLLTPASATATASENARALATYLQGQGLLVRPITYPTVPRGMERVRVYLHAGNTRVEVERFVEGVREWVRGERVKAREGPRPKAKL